MSGTANNHAETTLPVFNGLSNFERAALRVIKSPELLSVPSVQVFGDSFDKATAIAKDLVITARHLDAGPKLSCAGLAANQLGYNLRVIVVRVNKKYKAFINPEIVFKSGSKRSEEGCFSFPGKTTTVERATTIMVKASNLPGARKFKGMEAICFQHECDHLDGVLV